MSTETPDNDEKKQYEAQLQIARSLIDLGQLQLSTKSAKDDEMEFLKNHVLKCMIPPSYKNVSAEMLKEQLIDEYVQEASALLLQSFRDRKAQFVIKDRDRDLISSLQTKWADKGITSNVKDNIIVNGQECVTIELTW
jgi:hypothetical protein